MVPPSSPKALSGEAVDSAPVPPSLWVGAYPLVTLLLRLTLLAYPLGSTYLTVDHDGGDGTEWGYHPQGDHYAFPCPCGTPQVWGCVSGVAVDGQLGIHWGR